MNLEEKLKKRNALTKMIMDLKNQTPRVVKIKSMKDHGAEISQVAYQESPF